MGASIIKGKWMRSGFLLCLFLALIAGNANAMSYAEGTFEIDWSTLNINVTHGMAITFNKDTVDMVDPPGGSSKAKIEIDPDAADKQKYEVKEEAPPYTDTQAALDKTVANATASTTNNAAATKQSGSVRAESELGIKNKAESETQQWMYFTVEAAGTLELTLDYYLQQEIDVEAVDEWVTAKSEVKLELGKWWKDLDENGEVKLDKDGNEKIKTDKVDHKFKVEWKELSVQLDEIYKGELTVIYEYEAGELGFMKMVAKNKAEAYKAPPTPTPEPATMLLLGSGLIGLAGLRRKFKK